MKFEDGYELVKNKFMEADLSQIDTDFSGIACISGDVDHYIYAAYIGGQKFIEPVKHDSANIVVSLSEDTFTKIMTKELEAFKAFTTGKIKAKGNVFLAISLYKKFKAAKLRYI